MSSWYPSSYLASAIVSHAGSFSPAGCFSLAGYFSPAGNFSPADFPFSAGPLSAPQIHQLLVHPPPLLLPEEAGGEGGAFLQVSVSQAGNEWGFVLKKRYRALLRTAQTLCNMIGV